MRLRNIPGSREVIAENHWCIAETEDCKGKWHNIFGNDQPIHIEIGMGKGKFIMALAKQNPQINYVGIEKYSSVLLRGLQKMKEEPLENIRFVRMDAENICEIFDMDEVSRIYLNFSDPWPKDRHAKRRLTSRQFLALYQNILKSDGLIEFKTDNIGLFDFSLEEIREASWVLESFTRDLHHEENMNRGNIMTEYEEKFSAKGNPICKLVASLPDHIKQNTAFRMTP